MKGLARILQPGVRRRHSLSLLLAVLLAMLSGAPGAIAVPQGPSLAVEFCAQDFLALGPALSNAETRQAKSPALPLAILRGTNAPQSDASTTLILALGTVPQANHPALNARFGRAPPRTIPS
jgi:hypothetical protein